MKVYKKGEYFQFFDEILRAEEDLAVTTEGGCEVINGDASEILTFEDAATKADRFKVLNALTKASSFRGRR
jgi:hypothetical protein